MKKILAFVLLLMVHPAQAASGPENLIRDTSEKVIAEIRKNAASYQSNPQNIYRLVDEVVLPHFDFDSMTDLALGRFARPADRFAGGLDHPPRSGPERIG